MKFKNEDLAEIINVTEELNGIKVRITGVAVTFVNPFEDTIYIIEPVDKSLKFVTNNQQWNSMMLTQHCLKAIN